MKNIKFLFRIGLFWFVKMLIQVSGIAPLLLKIQLILSVDLIWRVYMWWNDPKFLCESNLENDLLNKIYVYQNGDSLDENHYSEILKRSLHSSVSTTDSIANNIDIKTFSSEQKLYWVTGCIIQFIKNLKRSQSKSNIVLINSVTIEELRNTKWLWLKANHRELEDEEEFKNTESCFRLLEDKDVNDK